MKKYIFALLIVGGGILFAPKFSFAQSYPGYTFTATGTQVNYGLKGEYDLILPFGGNHPTGTIDSISLNVFSSDGTLPQYINFLNCGWQGNEPGTSNPTCGIATGSVAYKPLSLPVAGVTTTITFVASSSPSFVCDPTVARLGAPGGGYSYWACVLVLNNAGAGNKWSIFAVSTTTYNSSTPIIFKTYDGSENWSSTNLPSLQINGGAVTGPVGSFLVPDGAYNGPDFSNWTIRFTPPASTNATYYGQIAYQVGDAWTFVNNIYTDNFSITTNSTRTLIWTIPKSQSLFNYQNNNGTSSNWIARLYLSTSPTFSQSSDESTFTITPFATSTSVGTTTQYNADGTTSTVSLSQFAGPFYWNAVQGNLNAATWNPQSLASSSAALAGQCTPAADWTDIGGGLNYAFCSVVNFLFVPPSYTTDFLQQSVLSIQSVPPFSYFFMINNSLASSTASSSDFTGSSFTITDGLDGHTSSIQLFPADISQNAYMASDPQNFGQSFANIAFNLILGAFIVIIVFLFYRLIL